jgi:hypothetical protein
MECTDLEMFTLPTVIIISFRQLRLQTVIFVLEAITLSCRDFTMIFIRSVLFIDVCINICNSNIR